MLRALPNWSQWRLSRRTLAPVVLRSRAQRMLYWGAASASPCCTSTLAHAYVCFCCAERVMCVGQMCVCVCVWILYCLCVLRRLSVIFEDMCLVVAVDKSCFPLMVWYKSGCMAAKLRLDLSFALSLSHTE